jgi:hypothetical protein
LQRWRARAVEERGTDKRPAFRCHLAPLDRVAVVTEP